MVNWAGPAMVTAQAMVYNPTAISMAAMVVGQTPPACSSMMDVYHVKFHNRVALFRLACWQDAKNAAVCSNRDEFLGTIAGENALEGN